MAGAEHHRLHIDAILVDQPVTRKGRGEVGAANHHVAARLLLQLGPNAAVDRATLCGYWIARRLTCPGRDPHDGTVIHDGAGSIGHTTAVPIPRRSQIASSSRRVIASSGSAGARTLELSSPPARRSTSLWTVWPTRKPAMHSRPSGTISRS